jgi:hypothetical protein
MKSTEIIEAIRQNHAFPGGRNLYGVLVTCSQLDGFAKKLHQVKATDGDSYTKPVNVKQVRKDENYIPEYSSENCPNQA